MVGESVLPDVIRGMTIDKRVVVGEHGGGTLMTDLECQREFVARKTPSVQTSVVKGSLAKSGQDGFFRPQSVLAALFRSAALRRPPLERPRRAAAR
jgi:hypothetical protein